MIRGRLPLSEKRLKTIRSRRAQYLEDYLELHISRAPERINIFCHKITGASNALCQSFIQ